MGSLNWFTTSVQLIGSSPHVCLVLAYRSVGIIATIFFPLPCRQMRTKTLLPRWSGEKVGGKKGNIKYVITRRFLTSEIDFFCFFIVPEKKCERERQRENVTLITYCISEKDLILIT